MQYDLSPRTIAPLSSTSFLHKNSSSNTLNTDMLKKKHSYQYKNYKPTVEPELAYLKNLDSPIKQINSEVCMEDGDLIIRDKVDSIDSTYLELRNRNPEESY